MDFGNWQRRFLASCLLLIMTGCAAVPQSLELSREPGNLPRRVMLDEVASFPQVKYQCGPAALATVLSHRNVDVVPESLIEKVYIPERKGSLQIEMVATARSYGKLTYPLENQLKALLAELAAGNPVLVFQNLSFSIWPQWHYAVALPSLLATDVNGILPDLPTVNEELFRVHAGDTHALKTSSTAAWISSGSMGLVR